MCRREWQIALLSKFPRLDLNWPPELRAKWLDCFKALRDMADSPQPQETE